MNSGRIIWTLLGLSVASTAPAELRIVDVHQGTNMAITLSPDGKTLVVDLVGQLWRLPAAGGGAEPLTPPEEPARNPRFSPDGRQIVYQRLVAGQWDLWTLDLDDRTRHALTGPPYNEREPDYGEDGSIVFVSDRAGGFDVWALDLVSRELSQLTAEPGQASFPSVSDVGDLIYVSQSGDTWTLKVRTSQGAPIDVHTSRWPLHAPSWRPGGGVVLFNEQRPPGESALRMLLLGDAPVLKDLTSAEDVFGFRPAWISPGEFIYTADGGIWRRGLASVERRSVPLFAGVAVTRADHSMRWDDLDETSPRPVEGIRAPTRSQDGGRLAFTALGDLWLWDETGEPERLTDDAYLEIDPAFTPEGDALIFASDRAGTMDLWQLTLADGRLVRLTSSPRKAYRPAISPDGEAIAYLETSGFGPWDTSSLRLLQLDKVRRNRTLVEDLIGATQPDWTADGGEISLQALSPAAESYRAGPIAELRVDLNSGSRRWAAVPDAASDLDPDLPNPPLQWSQASQPDHYVIQVDRLFDGVRTQYRRHMDIHVEGARITEIVARGLKPLPEIVIDARDHTVIPGLIDIHAHQSALAGERLGRIWLAYGVTTVREVGGDSADTLERGEAWASARRLGPRLLRTNPIPRPGATVSATADRSDFDVLEIYSAPPDGYGLELVQRARLQGSPIFSERLFPAASLGVNGLEHIGAPARRPHDLEMSSLHASYQDVVAVLTATGIAVTPTLAAFGGYRTLATTRLWSQDAAYRTLFHEHERQTWRSMGGPTAMRLEALQRTVARLVRSGGRIVAGADAPAVPYGLGLHAELALLSRAGIPNDQVLRLATAEAALALGLEQHLGTLEPGKIADLVVIRGNPLNQITDTLSIEAVVRGGIWMDRASLLSPP